MQWRDLGLWKYELEDNEWVILQQLHNILKILKDTMLYFSCATPNLATMIPAMDHIDKMLMSYSHNKKYLPSIRSAVQLAKKTLNRYYQLTDRSRTYRISMVLHPQHKLLYFKAAHWEDDWIETGEKLMHEEFERLYLSLHDGSDLGCEDDVWMVCFNSILVWHSC
ncbi:hypothetical protein BDR03DRAFT_866841 [Suillus americanus]|nr:hypothetical protein BDR03DRAFT_866841 [Suillus americanus]